jgi:hypothetical protein
MVVGPTPLRLKWRLNAIDVFQQIVVFGGESPALCVPFRQEGQFNAKQCRLKRIQASVIPLHQVMILSALPMIPNHLYPASQVLIVGRYSAGFSASAKVLPGIEAECSSLSDGPCA